MLLPATLRSWDYGNLRTDTPAAPLSVLADVLGLLLAVAFGAVEHGVEAITVTFTYYANATRIMFDAAGRGGGEGQCCGGARR